MSSVKIAGLGGGSLYFTYFLPELPLAKGLAGSEVVLYDLDVEKATRMAAMGQRLADAVGTRMTIRAAATLEDALDGADFAVSSIGGSGADVGKDVYYSYYHQADMHIPAKYGICQIIGDTCGPAGMMMALRSIPVYMNICRQMEKRCPRALLLNHSNPMAVLMRAMHKYTSVRATGVCHGVQSGVNKVAEMLNLPAEELDCTWIGTNHYYWFTRVGHRGADLTAKVCELAATQPATPGAEMCQALSHAYGHRIVYRSDDHIIEFYPYLARCTDPARLPEALRESASRHGFEPFSPMPARSTPDAATRQAFLTQYQEILDKAKPAEKLSNSYTGEGTSGLIETLAGVGRAVCIANIANRGAIPNLPDDAEVEVQAVVDSFGARPVYMGPAPRVLKGILEKRFAWHELVADAAVKGDRNAALQALLIDEMSIPPTDAAAMLDELLEASRPLLGQFFG